MLWKASQSARRKCDDWSAKREKAEKRKALKARKAAGITSESDRDRDTESTEYAAASDPAADLSTID